MESFLKSGKIQKNEPSSLQVKESQTQNLQWVEKYRPKTVEDIIEQKEVISVLQECISGADFPHLLFYGPPGTGKTSTILAAARQLFGNRLYKKRILELNASDERGIHVIREKILSFAHLMISTPKPGEKPCPPLKIVILDEADAMTKPAQASLRRIMEKESKNTRFCLLCNYISRIMDPLTSRCSKFRFKPLQAECIVEKLKFIIKEEKIDIDDDVLSALVEESNGDMRKAITALQSCANLKGKGKKITLENVNEVLTVVPKNLVQDFMNICSKPCDIKVMIDFISNLEKQAYLPQKIYEKFGELLIEDDNIPDPVKAEIGEYLAESSFRSSCSRSDFIHLLDFAINTQEILTVPENERKLKAADIEKAITIQEGGEEEEEHDAEDLFESGN